MENIRWIYKDTFFDKTWILSGVCSHCGSTTRIIAYRLPNYCPWCGKHMSIEEREKEDE